MATRRASCRTSSTSTCWCSAPPQPRLRARVRLLRVRPLRPLLNPPRAEDRGQQVVRLGALIDPPPEGQVVRACGAQRRSMDPARDPIRAPDLPERAAGLQDLDLVACHEI